MGPDHYFHPEFGWLAPTQRLRRELRIGFFSVLFGMSIGAIGVSALSVGSRDAATNSVSPVATRGVVAPLMESSPNGSGNKRREAANINIDQSRTNNEVSTSDPIKPDTTSTHLGSSGRKNGGTACESNKFTCSDNARSAGGRGAAESPAANDTPPVAPLGRVEPSTGILQAGGRSDVATEESQESVAPERSTPLVLQQDWATTDRPNSNAKSHKKPQNTGLPQNPQRQKPADDYRRVTADWTGGVDENRTRAGGAHVRDSSSGPLGFWDWSR